MPIPKLQKRLHPSWKISMISLKHCRFPFSCFTGSVHKPSPGQHGTDNLLEKTDEGFGISQTWFKSQACFSQLCDFGPASVSSSVKCNLWGLCEESEIVYCAWHTEYVQDKTRPPKCTQAEMGVRRAGGLALTLCHLMLGPLAVKGVLFLTQPLPAIT